MNKNELQVELVGGPSCGLVVDWPEHQTQMNVMGAMYCFEGCSDKGFTALFKFN